MIRNRTRAKLMYDFDDAIWLEMYHPMLAKYQQILSSVDCVSVDNEYLYDHAKPFCKEIFVFPPPAQIEHLPKKENHGECSCVTIGWIGSGSTSFYLYSLHSVLEELGRRYKNIRLLILGFSYTFLPFFENIQWEVIPTYNENVMNKARRLIDIGLFPLLPCVNSLGRGLCKPILYMGSGIPVVASHYGSVANLIKDGENGMLCKNQQEWIDKLSQLIENPTLRAEIGNAGLETAKQYTIENNFQLLENNFLSRL